MDFTYISTLQNKLSAVSNDTSVNYHAVRKFRTIQPGTQQRFIYSQDIDALAVKEERTAQERLTASSAHGCWLAGRTRADFQETKQGRQRRTAAKITT
ncbi:MAG: hypothetical protein IJ421_09265 [Prevotella sp.]|nr:hypothetical protein [Prevotella sp.]